MHPDFSGNVVKAMASAKKGYPIMNQILPKNNHQIDFKNFSENLSNLLHAKIKKINRLTEDIVELIIKAPLLSLEILKPDNFIVYKITIILPLKKIIFP